jgi:antitoxin component of MazEF toxin-antitoxin module
MPVFESSRKVQVFGSSLAMTLPAFFVKANEIEKGSVMSVHYGLDGVLVLSMRKDPEVTVRCLTKILDALEEKVREQDDDEGEGDADV